MKCFYHMDMDGKCAGAIIAKYISEKYPFEYHKCQFVPINYKDNFPFDTIDNQEKVFIVDFSLQKEGDFQRLLQITTNVFWIDHHKTAIEKHQAMIGLKGLRDITKSGCELTWEWCFKDIPTPRIVKLLGDYDTWKFKYGEDTNRLQAGIRLHNTEPTDNNWIEWFKEEHSLRAEIEGGYFALRYRDSYYKSLIKGWSFFAEFEGYKVVCCNAGSVSSQLFDSVKEDYDLMMPFVFDGKQFTVSIYTKKDIDCSELAKKYGGGGHKQAAGFQCKELPFGE